MFNIYSANWPEIECALVAFNKDNYSVPIVIWYTSGGYIEQDVIDCCGNILELMISDNCPTHGLWVWEGSFQSLDSLNNGVGNWRQPTDDEWICIIKQITPWKNYE